MREAGRAPLGPFALYIMRPTWIDRATSPELHRQVAWQEVGVENVPIVGVRGGFIVFEFDKSPHFSGGDVPAYSLGDDRRIPSNVTRASRDRDELAYRRFTYMNAFLLALYSGLSTVQKRAAPVQEPIDPTNYFLAEPTADGWALAYDSGRKIEYPRDRTDIVQIETLSHALQLIQCCFAVLGRSSLELLELVYIACHQYARHQFASAHLLAWSAIESLLNYMWLDLQSQISLESGGHTRLTKERKKLLEGRDYSASVISQILSLCNNIDDDLLDRLNYARKKRNAFAHSLERISSGDAGSAIRLATDMITRIADIRVTSQLSLSFWI